MKNAIKKNATKGILWFLASLVISCSNDVITKLTTTETLGPPLNFWEIIFFRLFFGTILLIPCILKKPISLHTAHHKIHLLRGGLFVAASALWGYGLSYTPITTATVISFTIPLFVLCFSVSLLKEHVTPQKTAATIIGFIGMVIILCPESTYNLQAISFILAAILFALLDVINKYYVDREALLSMIFYPALVAMILTVPFTYYYWTCPTIQQCLLLSLLGLGSNMIIFCLLQAYRQTWLSSLAPIRYLELFLSMAASCFIFNESLKYELWGALLIIPAVWYIVYEQQKQEQQAIKQPSEICDSTNSLPTLESAREEKLND